MSTAKSKKIERRGGPREGTGPKPGSGKMTKICVSVKKCPWDTALGIWRRKRPEPKPSWLVDKLVQRYADTGGSILEMEAA